MMHNTLTSSTFVNFPQNICPITFDMGPKLPFVFTPVVFQVGSHFQADTEPILSITFDPQSNDNILILNAIDKLTAIHAVVFQFKMAELQGGVHGVGISERSTWSKMAVWPEGMCI